LGADADNTNLTSSNSKSAPLLFLQHNFGVFPSSKHHNESNKITNRHSNFHISVWVPDLQVFVPTVPLVLLHQQEDDHSSRPSHAGVSVRVQAVKEFVISYLSQPQVMPWAGYNHFLSNYLSTTSTTAWRLVLQLPDSTMVVMDDRKMMSDYALPSSSHVCMIVTLISTMTCMTVSFGTADSILVRAVQMWGE
jgi:hypothetical protein